MGLIKCPECGKEISDDLKECIHCGYPLKNSIFLNLFDFITDNRQMIINIVSTIVLVILITFVGSIKTIYSGYYSIYELIRWVLNTDFDLLNSKVDLYYIILLILFYLPIIFAHKNKVANVFAKINLIFVFVIEVLFFLFLQLSPYEPNFIYILLMIYHFALIILFFIFNSMKNTTKQIVINKVDIPNLEMNTQSKLDKLVEIKKLYDEQLISKEEFDLLKKEVINSDTGNKN